MFWFFFALVCVFGVEKPPPRWGGNNTTLSWVALVNMTNFADAPGHPFWQFRYFYDWTLKADRYEHQEGQYDEVCAGFALHPLGEPCTVLNSLDGNMYILFPNDKNFCCRCMNSLTLRSDWLRTDNTTYQGQNNVNGQSVDEWLLYGASDNHYYATVNDAQEPVRFMEHKNGKLKQWDFISYLAEQPPQTLFKTPNNCQNKCQSKVCLTHK